jgi:hypothetical protein
MSPASSRTNRLAQETSPYLLQHAANPVDWYPWGPEALRRAKELDRPIFLSIGYSACHWCHVMAHECFEDARIAELLNRWFVSVKVDREERPDLDEIYMKAVQAMTGAGGWPMSVFLTPDHEPFFGGTYFPPEPVHGRPSFPQVLRYVAELWEKDRERAVKQGQAMAEAIAAEGEARVQSELDPGVLDRSLESLAQSYDPSWGGFGRAPKFPHATDIRLCLRHGKRTGAPRAQEMAVHTLRRMAAGGIHDQLGGGFARYSTDERWLVPHFEKMLYDNALLVPAYLEGFLVTGDEALARVARDTCAWVLRDMRTSEGGFASSLDADSEGEEGRYYVWTPDDLVRVLGEETGRWAAEWFDVCPEGNFEHGRSVPWRPDPPEEVAKRLGVPRAELETAMEEARARLLEERGRRVPPGKDDKILAAWNGLMISALALTHQVLGGKEHLDAARAAARFLLGPMRTADGRLRATARAGKVHVDAFLDDYAFGIQALLDLYETDFDATWLRSALELNEVLSDDFEDRASGGYFTTGSRQEKLIARLKSPMDGALPSGNGVQALNLLRLAELTGGREHAARAERTVRWGGELVNRYPAAFSQMLMAVDFLTAEPREIVIAGDPNTSAVRDMLSVVRRTFLPQRVVAFSSSDADEELIPLLADKRAPAGAARAFVCRGYTCGMPAASAEELAAQLA